MLRLWGQLLGGPTLGPWQGMEVNKAYFSAAELGRRRMMSGYGLHMFLEENDATVRCHKYWHRVNAQTPQNTPKTLPNYMLL
jgi:hypothetical protein